jgi:hypothetical protein
MTASVQCIEKCASSEPVRACEKNRIYNVFNLYEGTAKNTDIKLTIKIENIFNAVRSKASRISSGTREGFKVNSFQMEFW